MRDILHLLCRELALYKRWRTAAVVLLCVIATLAVAMSPATRYSTGGLSAGQQHTNFIVLARRPSPATFRVRTTKERTVTG
jgi:hypothetical protein